MARKLGRLTGRSVIGPDSSERDHLLGTSRGTPNRDSNYVTTMIRIPTSVVQTRATLEMSTAVGLQCRASKSRPGVYSSRNRLVRDVDARMYK